MPEGRNAAAPSADRAPASLHNIRFRHIRPEDWHRLQRFHRRLSPMTIELRFHGAKRDLSTPLAHYFTDLDGHNNVGIVATTGTRGRIVGVARYNKTAPTCAEVAFVIEDVYQHHGLGHRLMQRLRRAALENGITEFVAEVLPANAPMFRLLQELGPADIEHRDGVCEVHVPLVKLRSLTTD